MHVLIYTAVAKAAGPDEVLVTFPDVPEAITAGATVEEALDNAQDALNAALEGYLELGREAPAAGVVLAGAGEVAREIAPDPVLSSRLMLAKAMRAQGLTKSGLARAMGKDEKVARRVVSGKGVSLDLMVQALSAVGVRVALAA